MTQRVFPKDLENKVFSTHEAYRQGLTKYDLHQFLKNEEISKIAHGYYQHERELGLDEENIFESAWIRAGNPACVCLISALAHYGLTDLIGKKVWVMVPDSRRRNYSDLKLLRVRSPQWNIGIKKNPRYWITNLERTLVDSFIYKHQIGVQIALQGVRKAIQRKKSNLDKIFEMGKALGVKHKILPYLEALAEA